MLLCLYLLSQGLSISLLQLQIFMLCLSADVNLPSVLFMFFTKRCRDNNSAFFTLNSNSLSLFFIFPCFLFTASDPVCLNFPLFPSFSPLLCLSEEKLNLDDSEWEDIHVVTGALKLFFRELPEPLVPYGFFTDIVETISE